MISPKPGARIHLIGVGGTAMGALAGLLQELLHQPFDELVSVPSKPSSEGSTHWPERTSYIGRVRNLARLCAEGYLKSREEMGFPLMTKFSA